MGQVNHVKKLEESKLLFILFLIALFLIFSLGISYTWYMNVPGEPVNLNPVILNVPEVNNKDIISGEVRQFYPNTKFNHNLISYKVDSVCSEDKRGRIINAFDKLSELVGKISFKEVTGTPDIEVSCSLVDVKLSEGEYFIAGEGGAKEIIQTERYNVITNGVILLHDTEQGLKCDWPNVELHELIHVFGFNHSTDKTSLMYPYLDDCNQELDLSIVNELIRLYSEENLPDLYFENLEALKRGRYLDTNLSVRNSGTIDAEKIIVSIFDGDKLVENFNLGDSEGKLKYGAGIFIEIKNLKLIRRNPEEIAFIIDYDDSVDEIDEENNIAKIKF